MEKKLKVTMRVDMSGFESTMRDAAREYVKANCKIESAPSDPLEAGREALVVDGVVVTTPIPAEAAAALNEAGRAAFDAMAQALAPYGLHPNDIAVPKFRRVVYVDEVES